MMIHTIAMVLVLIGALNWGLVGVTGLFVSQFDLVEYLALDLIGVPILADITYIVVGVAAIVTAVSYKKSCAPGCPAGSQRPEQRSEMPEASEDQ